MRKRIFILSFKIKKRAQRREEKKSKISVRLQNVAERENTHLFSGAHIGHSLSVSAYPSKQLRKNVQESKTIMITWNPRACHVFYLHLMKRMLTQEMNGWQVQRSGAHTALCTLKYLRTSQGENCVTCVRITFKTRDKRRCNVKKQTKRHKCAEGQTDR